MLEGMSSDRNEPAPQPGDAAQAGDGPHPVGHPTQLLQRMAAGDAGAEEELYTIVYDVLHRLARKHMAGQQVAHTLQPTALVNEAWLRLAGGRPDGFRDRGQFLGFASRVMRSVLVDHARRRRADKRGGGAPKESLDLALAFYEESDVDLLDLEAALERLEAAEPELLRVVELRFFGGLTMEEAAEAMGVSLSTAERNWRLARVWLREQMAADG